MNEINIIAKSVELVPVSDLVEYPGNARKHSMDQIASLCGLIAEYGFTTPLLIDKDGMLISGHGRLLAAKSLGMFDVPCIRATHLSRAQIKALVIADNRIAELSSWDENVLRAELADLKDLDESLLGMTAFDFDEIDKFLNGALTDDADNGPELPAVKFLSVGGHKIELTPEENADLSDIFSAWTKHHGSHKGLVQHVIDAIRNYA
jgi:hypothetical protein